MFSDTIDWCRKCMNVWTFFVTTSLNYCIYLCSVLHVFAVWKHYRTKFNFGVQCLNKVYFILLLLCCRAFRWAISCGGKVPFQDGLEHSTLPGEIRIPSDQFCFGWSKSFFCGLFIFMQQ